MKPKLIILIALFIVAAFTFTAYAEIPHVMSFQGKATDKSGAPLNGTYNLTFRIYNTETGGTPKWTETQSNIPISNGIFQALLGNVTPLNLAFDEAYWIGVEINSDGEMSPRTKLASVPYAYRAQSLAEEPVIPFYKKGFDIEYVDFNSIKVTPGVMDVAGKMFTSSTYSSPLQLAYLDSPANRDWVHGQKTNNSAAYVYAYDNNGQIAFKLSDESPDLSDQLGNTTQKPLLYQKYPDTAQGIYYRCIGDLAISSIGTAGAIKNIGEREPVSIFSIFGGDGTNGNMTISSDTNFSDIDEPSRPGYAQFHNLTISAGKTLTVDTKFAYIGVNGTCTIHGTINADGQGGAGGTEIHTGGGPGRAGANGFGVGGGTAVNSAGSFVTNGTFAVTINTQLEIENAVSGAGGGGGGHNSSGGAGGGAGNAGGGGNGDARAQNGLATLSTKILRLTGGLGDNIIHTTFFNPLILLATGGGGGGGMSSHSGQAAGNGGAGGGIIYIECNELVFDGTLTANGIDGQPDAGGQNAGSGGGGGGGMVLVRAKILTTNSGTATVTEGHGVSDSRGNYSGDGAAGFKDIVLVP